MNIEKGLVRGVAVITTLVGVVSVPVLYIGWVLYLMISVWLEAVQDGKVLATFKEVTKAIWEGK